ncbi:MAG: hypothetical protein ACHP65_02840, partial [Legionellales bacterium]
MQRKLILADWSARFWSEEVLEVTHAALRALINQGFLLYIDLAGVIQPLLEEDLETLLDRAVLQAITPTHPDDIIRAAFVQLGLSRDEVHIINNYWADLVVSAVKTVPQFHTLSIGYYTSLKEEEQLKLHDILQQDKNKENVILHDEFSMGANKAATLLRKGFPALHLQTNYQRLCINNAEFHCLLVNKLITIGGITCNMQALRGIDTLQICDSRMDIVQLSAMLAAMPKLKKLVLHHCIITGNVGINDQGLYSTIQWIFIVLSQINSASLQSLLINSSNLLELSLDRSQLIGELLDVTPDGLPTLRHLACLGGQLSSGNLSALLHAAPNLTRFSALECRGLTAPITISNKSHPQLRLIRLSPSRNLPLV